MKNKGKVERVEKIIRDGLRSKIIKREKKEKKLSDERRTWFAVASEERKLKKKIEKIEEELGEVKRDLRGLKFQEAMREIGDLLDAVELLANSPIFNRGLIEESRREKRERNGGFDKCIIASFHPATLKKLHSQKPKPKAKARSVKKRKPR